jgi:hypothetical protein
MICVFLLYSFSLFAQRTFLAWRAARALKLVQILLKLGNGISIQPQFADDILRNVSLDFLRRFRLTLGLLQQVVEFFGVKLQALEQPCRSRHHQQQLLDHSSEHVHRCRRLFPRLTKLTTRSKYKTLANFLNSHLAE